MKTALSAIAIVTALTLAPFVGGSFAVADDSAQREDHGRFSPEDRAAFLDARIAALKAGLELNAEQEKNWAPLESAMRDLAKQRAERFAAWRERRDDNQDGDAEISPVDRLARASERLKRSRGRPAETGCRREAPLRQPGRRPEASVRRAFPWVHGSRPRSTLAPRRLRSVQSPAAFCRAAPSAWLLVLMSPPLLPTRRRWRGPPVCATLGGLTRGGIDGEGTDAKQQGSQKAEV